MPPGHADGIEPAQLAELPLYLTARDDNPPLVDLVMAACKTAGFDPLRGPAHSSLQDTLAALGAGAPGWTVLYGTAARELRPGRVAFLPVRTPGGFALPTVLAVHGAAVPYGLATPS